MSIFCTTSLNHYQCRPTPVRATGCLLNLQHLWLFKCNLICALFVSFTRRLNWKFTIFIILKGGRKSCYTKGIKCYSIMLYTVYCNLLLLQSTLKIWIICNLDLYDFAYAVEKFLHSFYIRWERNGPKTKDFVTTSTCIINTA